MLIGRPAIKRRDAIALDIGGERLGKRFPFIARLAIKAHGIFLKIARKAELGILIDVGNAIHVKRHIRDRHRFMRVMNCEVDVTIHVDKACREGRGWAESEQACRAQ